MKELDPKTTNTLGRRMFFSIENKTGRDKCSFCQGAQGKMAKHMATGLNICPACVEFIGGQMNQPDEVAPMHQAPPIGFDHQTH